MSEMKPVKTFRIRIERCVVICQKFDVIVITYIDAPLALTQGHMFGWRALLGVLRELIKNDAQEQMLRDHIGMLLLEVEISDDSVGLFNIREDLLLLLLKEYQNELSNNLIIAAD